MFSTFLRIAVVAAFAFLAAGGWAPTAPTTPQLGPEDCQDCVYPGGKVYC